MFIINAIKIIVETFLFATKTIIQQVDSLSDTCKHHNCYELHVSVKNISKMVSNFVKALFIIKYIQT